MANFFPSASTGRGMTFFLSGILCLWMLSVLASTADRIEPTDLIGRIYLTASRVADDEMFYPRHALLIEGRTDVSISSMTKIKISALPTSDTADFSPVRTPYEKTVCLSEGRDSFSETLLLPYTFARDHFNIEIKQANDLDSSAESAQMFKSRNIDIAELDRMNNFCLNNCLSPRVKRGKRLAESK